MEQVNREVQHGSIEKKQKTNAGLEFKYPVSNCAYHSYFICT